MLNMHMPDLQEESEHSIGGLWLVLPQRYQAAVARVMSGQVKNVVCGEFKDIKKQLPKSISCLTAVDDITLDYCKLTGDIPDVFAALTNLTSLDLKHNSLTGVLPISFSLLSGLRFLDMSGNRLCGEFPALPNTNLETICITCNRFMGPIPTVFRRPSKLTVLQVEYNHFSAIPPSIGQLTSLGELLISGNPISSEIPAEMWNLPAMRVLEMSGCHLFGSLAGIGALRNLWYLNVANNQLGGRLPSREICTMQRLEHLHLSHNQFSGVAGGTLDTSRMPNLTTWSADSGIRSRRCFEAHDSGDDSSGSDPDPEPDSESE
ncbi:hypothetical protein BJ741DRAFT_631927 [Chytriomyces cf. hyalinus JEL632]|nr:hypothetical protein BJ741DRAFT_631927 [Chytriomyces cf. hyalinus JEL632]